MRRISKRILALLCCIVLAAGLVTTAAAASLENCPGSCTHEAAIGTTHYDTLAQALAAATDGCTVTMLTDVTAGNLTLEQAITLDLGGKTLTGQLTYSQGQEGLLSTSKDLVLTNGTLTTYPGICLRAADCSVRIEKTVTMNAGGNALELHGSGKLEITGGEISAKDAAVVLNIADNKAMEASITGGKFLVEGENTVVITAGTDATAPKAFIIGGTYNKVPTDYISGDCRVDDNGDGTYTVTAEYSITFAANGASGTMSAVKADRGTTITLPACTFTAPAGKHFQAWDIGGKTYAPGATFAVNGPITLKAIWASHTGGHATCTAKATCSVCGSSYGEYASHNLTQVSAYAATCTSAGMNAHSKCSTCGQLFVSGIAIRASSLTIPSLGHQMQEVEGQEATCTEEGIAAHEKCDICGLLLVDGESVSQEELIVPATGHTLKTVPAVAATCTQTGTLAHEVCTECGEITLNGKVVEAEALVTEMTAHVLSDWQSDAVTHWKACSECGEVFRQHSHKDSDADEVCDDCGYAMPAAQETAPSQESKGTFPFLIPLIVAVVIAVVVILIVAKKKKS